MRVGIAAALLILVGCGPSTGADSENVEDAPFLRDSKFEMRAMDTGNRAQQCLVLAPWGDASWGIEASTFSDPETHALDGARFAANGREAYFYGREASGRWGFVRFVQGDMWGGTHCGPIGWHVGAPVDTFDRELVLEIDVYRDQTELLSWFQSWAMLAINVWFSSEDMPEAGGDKNGKKPLVMDLAVHNDCNWPLCGLRNFVDDDAYHYQARVAEAPEGSWQRVSFSLSEHLRNAIDVFDLGSAEASLKLYQLEFLIELKNAESAATFDNFRLDVR